MKFLSYNIQYGKGQDGEFNLYHIAEAIKEADVVCIQEIEVKTLIVTSKNENPNKKPLQNENWTKRKCLCCGKIFDSWGIGNRLCKGCKQSLNPENKIFFNKGVL